MCHPGVSRSNTKRLEVRHYFNLQKWVSLHTRQHKPTTNDTTIPTEQTLGIVSGTCICDISAWLQWTDPKLVTTQEMGL